MSPRTPTPPWATITVLSLGGMAASLQFTLLIPLLPELPELLGVLLEDASWLITATLITAAVSTPIVSRMADMYGKRRMLVISLTMLALGSIICALSTALPLMLLGRALQGFSASLVAVGISILRDELPPAKIASAVALMSATLGIGAALGLPLSGILVDLFGWHSVFWFTAIISVVLTIGLVLLVPESPLLTRGRFDVVGALLLSMALVAILPPVTKGTVWGWDSPEVLGLVTLGLVLLAAWVPWELRANQPMVDLRTAARRPVLLTNIASIFVGFAMFVNMLVTTQFLQQPEETGFGLGLGMFATGLAMAPAGLVMVVIAPLSGRLLDCWGGRRTLMLGVAIMSVAYVGRVFFSGSLTEVVLGSALVGVGTAVAFAAMPTLIMASVPITETASANGLNSLVRSVGTSLASALVATILSAMSVGVAGVPRPTSQALDVVLWLAVVSTVVAMGLAWFIPAETPGAERDGRRQGADEAVIGGRVVTGDPELATAPSMVSVLALDGAQLDWSRADRDGVYSVVVPGAGTYVLVANAQGWASAAHVVEFDGAPATHDLHLTEQLTISGTVSHRGEPCPGAVVVLGSLDGGKQLGSARCGENGRYVLPLPPVGRYVLTAVTADGGAAHAHKVLITLQSHCVDIDLPARPS